MHALVVDDSKPVRSILTKVLGGLRFECREAGNGVEALDQLVRMPRPAVVTINRHMPEMDGIELIQRLRRSPQYRDLRLVMISTDCDAASVQAARAAGADDFVAKPFTPSDLISRLAALGVTAAPVPVTATEATRASGEVAPIQASAVAVTRVLVVDDSATIRSILTSVLGRDEEVRVVATAANGEQALARLQETPPDVVLLDVEMPVMDGLETLRRVRKQHPRLPVVMFSSLTERGARATLEALVAGANDYVAKPAGGNPEEITARIRTELIPKIKAVHRRRDPLSPQQTGPKRPGIASADSAGGLPGERPARIASRPIALIVMGVSTGGPSALAEVLPSFVGPASPPVVIVQHMPAEFTKPLAERLAKICGRPVREAVDGQLLSNGDVLLAPGGLHVEIGRAGEGLRVTHNRGQPENSCRPSVDVLFRSAARVCGSEVLAVILTGMGSDGLIGSGMVSAAGGRVIAQDEATSVVWGMPGQVVRAGLADQILPLDRIGPEIALRLRRQAATL
jgi:two-component system chemotaxis response regulator CheB